MKVEYEVFNLALDALLEPIVCRTSEEATIICDKIVALTGCDGRDGWQVREVEAGKRPIPPRADVTTPVTVDEVRKLMAKHGQSLMVTFAWNARDGVVNIATAGDCRKHSEWALNLSQMMAEAVGLEPGAFLEDRRAEHPN